MSEPLYKWIKADVDILNERAYFRLNAAARGVYIDLYRLAGRVEADGELYENGEPLDAEMLAEYLRLTPDVVNTALMELTQAGLIALDVTGVFTILRFPNEQMSRKEMEQARSANRERQKKHRQKSRVSNALGTPQEEKDIEEDIEEDIAVNLTASPENSQANFWGKVQYRDGYIEVVFNKLINASAKALRESGDTRAVNKSLLEQAAKYWLQEVENHNAGDSDDWNPIDIDAILERYEALYSPNGRHQKIEIPF